MNKTSALFFVSSTAHGLLLLITVLYTQMIQRESPLLKLSRPKRIGRLRTNLEVAVAELLGQVKAVGVGADGGDVVLSPRLQVLLNELGNVDVVRPNDLRAVVPVQLVPVVLLGDAMRCDRAFR
jgi:hypothetical protein